MMILLSEEIIKILADSNGPSVVNYHSSIFFFLRFIKLWRIERRHAGVNISRIKIRFDLVAHGFLNPVQVFL